MSVRKRNANTASNCSIALEKAKQTWKQGTGEKTNLHIKWGKFENKQKQLVLRFFSFF